MKRYKFISFGFIISVALFPTGIASADVSPVPIPQVVCTAQMADGSTMHYSCPDVQFDTYQVDVIPGADPLTFTWNQSSRFSRTYWGPSYATSTEVMYVFYLGQVKAAANIYDGLRIVQVCAWYSRANAIISDVACSNASSNTGQWVAGYVANTNAWDDLNPNAPKTQFVYRLGKINPNIY